MKLERFKERNNKRTGIIVFTITCILLVSGVILYRTFAIFEVRTNQNVIKGTVQDPGNLYFAFYQKNEESGEYVIQKDMPDLNAGYVLDEVQSYCGVNGENDKNIQVYLSEDGYIKVKGMTTSRTKCNLYFAKGVFIKEKGIPVVTSGDGLYKVAHPASETGGMEEGWNADEYRYAGVNPNNYVNFNDELWRIIGLVNVKVIKEDESAGIEQRLKIIRDESIKNYALDSIGVNIWTQATLMKMLNNGYYNSFSNVECYMDESNGAIIKEKSICNFSENGDIKGFNELARSKVEKNIIWNIGGWNTYNVKTSEMYVYERGKTVWGNYSTEWPMPNEEGKYERGTALVGLMYSSDYGYAVGGQSRSCMDSTELGNYHTCTANNWLYLGASEWLLSPNSEKNYHVFAVASRGYVTFYGANNSRAVRPVVYLSPSVKIISGTGTSDDAFQLELKS